MAGNITVYVEKDSDIIVQRVEGMLDEQEFERMYQLTAQAAQNLRNTSHVCILVDGRGIAMPKLGPRKAAATLLQRAPFTRLALWGAPPIVRITIRLLAAAIGRKDIRAFRTEEEARQWLMENRPSCEGRKN